MTAIYATCSMQMPSNYVTMDAEEMEYLEGGATRVISGTAAKIRQTLETTIKACAMGNVGSVGVSAAGVIGFVGTIVGTAMGAWFTNVLSKASAAHSTVEMLIRKYGIRKNCTLSVTWAGIWCTGMDVSY